MKRIVKKPFIYEIFAIIHTFLDFGAAYPIMIDNQVEV